MQKLPDSPVRFITTRPTVFSMKRTMTSIVTNAALIRWGGVKRKPPQRIAGSDPPATPGFRQSAPEDSPELRAKISVAPGHD
jgi:hypothetical protein